MSARTALSRGYWMGAIGLTVVIAAVAVAELASGRAPFGPDGRFGWWDGDIWSSTNSQRVADAYSFSHFIHGILFYGFLWLVARRLPTSQRFVMAVAMEGAWELLENSPFIIDRYRAATIAQGYVGDSVLNSSCDILFAGLGFLFALKCSARISLAVVLAMELGCLVWVRDNLTLNVIMLVRPIEAIKTWQSQGR
ncbi:MAG: DUF2585 family protein [Verrucomicrobiales bacterium]|nr:DUF2585 family protein [Verrucomicrobiales bacterium]